MFLLIGSFLQLSFLFTKVWSIRSDLFFVNGTNSSQVDILGITACSLS